MCYVENLLISGAFLRIQYILSILLSTGEPGAEDDRAVCIYGDGTRDDFPIVTKLDFICELTGYCDPWLKDTNLQIHWKLKLTFPLIERTVYVWTTCL